MAMRRTAKALLAQAGAMQASASSSGQVSAAAALPQLVRHMSGGGGGFERARKAGDPETPLTNIMPGIVALPRQVVTTALGLTGKLIIGAATSGAVKSAVTSVADKLVVEEAAVAVKELDPSYWAYWLSALGYSNNAGFRKLAEVAKAKLPSLSAQQVTDLTVGFHTAKYYDKDLYNGIAANVSANFTKFETEQLLKILSSFAEHNHYSAELFDDAADSIAYANHYLAPVKADTAAVAAGLGAFAKFKHERADALLTLARGISEVGLSKLGAAERKTAVATALQAFATFGFYPEQVDALLFYANTEAASFSSDELATAAKVKAAVEAQTGGHLETWDKNTAEEDAVHWYGHHQPHSAPSYDLYVFRESLIPKSYSPASLRPRK